MSADISGGGNNKVFKTAIPSGTPYQYISASLDLTGLNIPSEGVTLYFRTNGQLIRVPPQVIISEVVLYSNPAVDAAQGIRFSVGGAIDAASPVESENTWGGPTGNSPGPVSDADLNDGAVCYYGSGPGGSLILAVTIEPSAIVYRTVAGGSLQSGGSAAMYSDDGINWTEAPTASDILAQIINTVAFSGTQWLIGGFGQADPPILPFSDYCAAQSSDGITFSNVPGLRDLFNNVVALVWTGSKWIAGGVNSGGGTDYYRLGYSDSTGTNWTIYDTGFAEEVSFIVNSLATDGSITVATISPQLNINESLLYLEDNSTTWVPADSGGTLLATGSDVAWNGTQFIAVGFTGGSNNMVSSPDGKNWTAVPSAFTANGGNALYAIAWNGVQWVAGGNNEAFCILYSSDGVTWTGAASANNIFSVGLGYVNNVCWNGSVWIAVGYCEDDDSNPIRTVGYSPDGINWSNSPSGFSIIDYDSSALASKLVPGVGMTSFRSVNNGGIHINGGTLHVTMKIVPRFT